MKKSLLALAIAPCVALSACGNAREDEARRLGFTSVSEMEEIQSKGWHTNAQYRADETERAKRLGFIDMDELHDAESDGIMDPVAYRKHLAAEEARERREEAAAAKANAGSGNQDVAESRNNDAQPPQSATVARKRFTPSNYTRNSISCKQEARTSCAAKSDWESLCQQASGITEMAGKIAFASWEGDAATTYLYDNGGYQGEAFEWRNSKSHGGYDGTCVVTMSISGTYKGSQVERNKMAEVTDFIVKGDGSVIASRVDTYGY